ncbi:MAG: DNA polymerase IV, partial [Deltaproteobacteria bacterium CG_4_8_14_3_um_filter_51_11]
MSYLRSIIHLDMDAFYPSVEIKDNPALKGQPVIVGGGRERGVVASASYEARRSGVHSAMPIAEAMRLCPGGIFLPVRMARYKEVSTQIFEIFNRFTPLVEPLSIDEAFLDVTGSERLMGDPVEIARRIKAAVLAETGLTVSAGVAHNKFVAKVASEIQKPDGLTVIQHDAVVEFLDPLPISRMWGVGRKMEEALAALNVRTFRDLRLTPLHLLNDKFGEHGIKMHRLSLGMDEREVVTEQEAKSVGHEKTFTEDILDLETAKRELLGLADAVGRRLRREGVRGKTVTLKVKYSDFNQITRACTLKDPTDDGLEIYSAVIRLLQKTQVGKRPLRLLGISFSNLNFSEEEKQLSFFGNDGSAQRKKRLNEALDSIYLKHGDKSAGPAALLRK